MSAATSVLLVSTASRWYSTARAPRALAKAGFEVTLLAPRDSLAAASRFVSRIAHLPDAATTSDWLHAFAATVKAARPALVVPADDVSFRLLAMLVVAPPPQLQAPLHEQLAGLIRGSLGDPSHYDTTQDKALLAHGAADIGMPVAVQAVVATTADALRFADRHGLPVVVKRRGTDASEGVQLVESRDALALAMTGLLASDDAEAGAAARLRPRSSASISTVTFVITTSPHGRAACWPDTRARGCTRTARPMR
jgi:glutathione synthase/RimK-type ligase-like ATP-grasp enzyme